MTSASASDPAAPPERGLTRRDLLIAGALGSAAVVPALISPGAQAVDLEGAMSLERLVPERVESWRHLPSPGILIPKGEGGDESYDDVLTRYYVSESASPVMLLIGFGGIQSGNAQLHRPEVCYPAAGFHLDHWEDIALALSGRSVSARAVTAAAPGRIEQILYWTRIGSDFPTSSLAQRWSILRHSIRGSLPDGTLVRISTIDPNRARAVRSLRTFAASLVGSGSPRLRELLIGRG
jgi:EpsI family protein